MRKFTFVLGLLLILGIARFSAASMMGGATIPADLYRIPIPSPLQRFTSAGCCLWIKIFRIQMQVRPGSHAAHATI